LYHTLLPFKCLKKVWNYAYDNNIGCILNTTTVTYRNKYVKEASTSNKITIDNIYSLNSINIYQIVITSSNYLKMERIKEFIEKETSLKIINSSSAFLRRDVNANNYFFDVVTNNTNKGNAIKNFLNLKNISKEHTICFGDGVNDHDMFKECGITIAMDNASSDLKEKANFITTSNDNDGVAKFFTDYIFNN